jgi:hypothetical protein
MSVAGQFARAFMQPSGLFGAVGIRLGVSIGADAKQRILLQQE